jgi:hypothetical protein
MTLHRLEARFTAASERLEGCAATNQHRRTRSELFPRQRKAKRDKREVPGVSSAGRFAVEWLKSF